jgi:peptidoglycan biosynthesis protein MviN/MurJ (putative lipid II flippase)
MAMLIGTILVALGFASGVMYFVHARKLKSRLNRRWSFRLPSLEYLQKLGQSCTLGSAAAIGFGVVSGAIMNFTRDGFVAWTDRGILLTTALFVWLCIAALAQKISSNRGKGEWTAALNILSFAIVVATLAAVVTAPHGVSTWGDA